MKPIIDISEFNSVTDWTLVKKNVDLVIIRMGYRGSISGKITYDKKYKMHRKACEEHGIPHGFYFFPTSVSYDEAVEEADWVANELRGIRAFACPVFADSEKVQADGSGRSDRLSVERRTCFLKAFCARLQLHGIPAGVYASTYWLEHNLDMKMLPFSVWVAQYAPACSYKGDYIYWQYTSKGQIPGISGYVDMTVPKMVSDEWYDKTFNPQTVIDVALGEIGYIEKKTGDIAYLYDKIANAGSNNFTKYGYEMHNLQPKNMDYPAAWCFPKGTLVLTDTGYKDICDIRAGDKVLSGDGTHFNTVQKVLCHEEKLYKMSCVGALPILSTVAHPFYSRKRKFVRKDHGFKDVGYNPVKELKKGDGVGFTMTKFVSEDRLSYNDAWLIGYYVGDGWQCRKEYFVCGSEEKCKKIETHVNLIKEKMYKSRTCQHYRIPKDYDRLFPVLDDCGKGAANKRVPKAILYSDQETKQAFLDGYMDADGFSGTRYNSASSILVHGIAKIATDLGYGAFVRVQKRAGESKIFDKRDGKERDINIRDLYYGAINTSGSGKHNSCVVEDGYSWHTVKSVEETDIFDTVYNITTDGDHTYTANNMAVHNCDAYVDWCFMYAYGAQNAKELLGGDFDDYTVNSAQLYKSKGQWHYSDPEPGDQIFFKNSSGICHTGLVYKVENGYVYTVEGNTSSEVGVVSNGGCVRAKSYPLSYTKIAGYGRPNYSRKVIQENPPKVDTSKYPLIKIGSDRKDFVLLLQNALTLRGYPVEIDGVFGTGTRNAVIRFQSDFHLDVDGEVGPQTWKALFN